MKWILAALAAVAISVASPAAATSKACSAGYTHAIIGGAQKCYAAASLVGLVVGVDAAAATAGRGSSRMIAALNALHGSSGDLTFPQLEGASEIACTYKGQHDGNAAFTCRWKTASGSSSQGNWEFFSGRLARLSGGGEGGHPPTSNTSATQTVNAVVAGRDANGSEQCEQILHLKITGVVVAPPTPHTYSCVLIDSAGNPIEPNGTAVRELWAWNADGSLEAETIDEYGAEEVLKTSPNGHTSNGRPCGTITSGTLSIAIGTSGPTPPSCAVAINTATSSRTGEDYGADRWLCTLGDWDDASTGDFECIDHDGSGPDVITGLVLGGPLSTLVSVITDQLSLANTVAYVTPGTCTLASGAAEIVLAGPGAALLCSTAAHVTYGGLTWSLSQASRSRGPAPACNLLGPSLGPSSSDANDEITVTGRTGDTAQAICSLLAGTGAYSPSTG